MDTTDPWITFDKEGVCSYCGNFETNAKKVWFPNEEGRFRLQIIVDKIISEGSRYKYDSIIGLSGGVDSSYLALTAKKLGLRPLAVHVDTGWNTNNGITNIENIVKVLGIDLYTYVVDWEEMKDLQVAYMKSGVENQDTPQDHVIFAALYRYAIDNKIKYVLSGSNYATESVLPSAWGHDAMDLRQLKAIHKKFGRRKLKTFPTINFFQYRFFYPYIKKMRVVDILNYVPYDRRMAIKALQEEVGFREYGNKHHESQFTKFFQGYYLPTKYGFDKRRAHLSSMILSGQITRDEALKEIRSDVYEPDSFKDDRDFVLKKLGLTEKDYSEIMLSPNRSYRDYPTSDKLRLVMSGLKATLRNMKIIGRER